MKKISYKAKYKKIQKFVNFNFDLRYSEKNFENKLSRQEKSEITHYFRVLYGNPKSDREQGAVNYDVYEYRPRKESHKKMAAEYAQIKGGYKKLKVIPIPRAEKENKPKLDFSKGFLEVKEENITRRISYFNMKELAKDPKMEVLRVVKELNESGEIDAILPLAGAREILDGGQTDDPEFMAEKIIALMNKYQESFQKWLLGLAGYEFTNQEDFFDYRQARKKTKKPRIKRCKNCKEILNKTAYKNNKCQNCGAKIAK